MWVISGLATTCQAISAMIAPGFEVVKRRQADRDHGRGAGN